MRRTPEVRNAIRGRLPTERLCATNGFIAPPGSFGERARSRPSGRFLHSFAASPMRKAVSHV
jgi:hypothetical protein